MAPFKNEGWAHWDKMEQANPGQVAGGSHVFTPLVHASPAPLFDVGDDQDDLSGAAPIITGAGPTDAHAVTAEWLNELIASSVPTNMNHDRASSAAPSTPSLPTSSITSGHDASSATLLSSSAPSSSQGKGKGRKRASEGSEMPPPKKPMSTSSSRLSSHADTTSSSGIKAGAPSVRIMMNNTVNTVTHLMDMLKDNMSSDRGRAIESIQVESAASGIAGGWDDEDVGLMIEVFTCHLNYAESYLALRPALRKRWVQRHLDTLHAQILQGSSVSHAVNSLGQD